MQADGEHVAESEAAAASKRKKAVDVTEVGDVRVAEETRGVSPKVIASALTGLVVYLLTKLAVQVDPVIEQAINVLAMIVAGYLAPPGKVKVPSPA